MYKEAIEPVLQHLDSETWHVRTREALHYAEYSDLTLKIVERIADPSGRFKDERLNVVLGGIELENPVMVGAGWDKAGRAVKGLHALGFAGVEVGSVLEYPQEGNPKKRQFMIGPGVCLNRLGFNTPKGGLDEVEHNLENYSLDSGLVIGISVGKNKTVDPIDAPRAHAAVVKSLYRHASYFVINVSSPNTPGLRSLQDKKPLTDIVQAVNSAMDEIGERKPLFVKIAPDLTNTAVDDVIEVVIDNGLTGIIATNTTNNPDIKAKYGQYWRTQEGGVSGDDPDYRKMATEKVSHIYKVTRGNPNGPLEIIGVGGIKDTETALEKIKAGARVVQVVTAIRGEGPRVAANINKGLVKAMERERVGSISEYIGADHQNFGS